MDQGTAIVSAALVGALAGVAGQIVASWLGRGRDSAARTQARLERTYERVMAHVNRIALAIQRTEPDFWIGSYPPTLPEPISDDDMLSLESQIGLFGSDQVRQQLRAFSAAQNSFMADVGLYRTLKAGIGAGVEPRELIEPQRALLKSRAEVFATAKAIEATARAELRR